jgi:hypothetical protein
MIANTQTVTFYPSILYRDPDAAVAWREGTLGYERREEHRGEAGDIAPAELSLGPAIVMLGSPREQPLGVGTYRPEV